MLRFEFILLLLYFYFGSSLLPMATTKVQDSVNFELSSICCIVLFFRYTSSIEELICECMVVNPMERPFIDQILNKTQTLAKSSSHIA